MVGVFALAVKIMMQRGRFTLTWVFDCVYSYHVRIW